MSQQDLERGDQEVMGIVNDHAHPDTAALAVFPRLFLLSSFFGRPSLLVPMGTAGFR